LFAAKYILPRNSPITPKATNWIPPKNKITINKEVQPTGVSLVIDLKKTNHRAIIKPEIEKKNQVLKQA